MTTPLPAPPNPAGTLVSRESPGDVVVLEETRSNAERLVATVAVPSAPGFYRLSITLHGADDAALDAATQERIPALVVHVTGSVSATVTAPERATATTGSALELPIAVLNSGNVPWGTGALTIDPEQPSFADPTTADSQLVGHWLRLDHTGGAGGAEPARVRAEPAPARPSARSCTSSRRTFLAST